MAVLKSMTSHSNGNPSMKYEKETIKNPSVSQRPLPRKRLQTAGDNTVMLLVAYGELCVQHLGGLILCHDLESPSLGHFESCIFRTIVIFLHLPCFAMLC